MYTASNSLPKLPKFLIWLVWLICLLPFTLNILGVDFASPTPPDLSLIQEVREPNEAKEIMYRTLSGSFLHTILEWSAFCAAIFTVVLSFAHFKIKADVTTPILGVTLFCAGMMGVGKGTGLGLSIAKQIVEEKHQGSLECISTVNFGTEFIIKIPICD